MTEAVQAGILDVSGDDYHADQVGANVPTLSASIATILCQQTPLHAWAAHPRLNTAGFKEDQAAHLDVGTVAHAILLQSFDIVEVIDAADWRTAAAKAAREDARAAGKVPLLEKDHARVTAMVAAVNEQLDAHPADPPIFAAGEPEQTLVWEEAGGVVCRSRLDWLRTDLAAIDDLKTTGRSADPRSFERKLFDHGYDVKAAFYQRGVQAIRPGIDLPPMFRWVVVETAPPYALSVVTPSAAVLTIGRKKVEYAISLWRDCLAADSWPGWTSEVAVAELPDWEEAKWLRKELEAA